MRQNQRIVLQCKQKQLREKLNAFNNYSGEKRQFIISLNFILKKNKQVQETIKNKKQKITKKALFKEEKANKKTLLDIEHIPKIYQTQLKDLKYNQEKSEIVSQNPDKLSKQINKNRKSPSNSTSNSPQKSSSQSSPQTYKLSSSQTPSRNQIRASNHKKQVNFIEGEVQQRQQSNSSTYLEEEEDKEFKCFSEVVVLVGEEAVNSQNNCFQIEIQNPNLNQTSCQIQNINTYFSVLSQQGFEGCPATSINKIQQKSDQTIANQPYYSGIQQEQYIQQNSYQQSNQESDTYSSKNTNPFQFFQTSQYSTNISTMDDHRHQEMIDEGEGNKSQKQFQYENNLGTPVFNSKPNKQTPNSFFPETEDSNNTIINQNHSKNTNLSQKQSSSSENKNSKNKGFFSFPEDDQSKEPENSSQTNININGNGTQMNINQSSQKDPLEPKENMPINIQQPQQQQQKKKPFNLFLPIAEISKAEKEIPLQTDGNSQKKKQNVFNFYDNFHEYTVFCDVAMKKCSRENQEDRFQAISPLDEKANDDAFFAVFDGHGTSAIADIVKENLHVYIVKNENYPKNIELAAKESFKKIDEEILKKQQDQSICSGGTTALCCLIKEDQLYIINCGDCSSVLVTNDYEVKVLNKLHKPNLKEEQERLKQKNVIFTDSRVVGSLAVTRALGDFKHKEYITSEPEVSVYKIDENFKYLLLGTDGFWDIIHYQQDLPDLLRKRNSMDDQSQTLKDLSTYLVEHASGRRTSTKKDNMTLLAIDLNWYYRQNNEEKEIVPESMLSSSCVMCSKSQYKINTEISSFLFQMKSPHSVGRSIERRTNFLSSQNKNLPNDLKTCGKNQKKKIFFGSENTDDESNNKNEELKQLDGLVLVQKESLQVPMASNNNIMKNSTYAQGQSLQEFNTTNMTTSFGVDQSNLQQSQNQITSIDKQNNIQFQQPMNPSSVSSKQKTNDKKNFFF